MTEVLLFMNETDSKLVNKYKRVGFLQRIGFGERLALLIVDFLKGFTNPKSPFGANLDKEIEATAKLLALARKKGVLVVFTTVGYEEGYKDAGIWIRKIPTLIEFRLGSEMVEIDSRIAPITGEYTGP